MQQEAASWSAASTKKKPERKKRVKKVRKWKKPEGKPKRPLSAYNIFFSHERRIVLEQQATGSTGSMGFAGLARNVAARWKSIDVTTKAEFQRLAQLEQVRYKQAVAEWEIETGRRPADSKKMVAAVVEPAAENNPANVSTFAAGGELSRLEGAASNVNSASLVAKQSIDFPTSIEVLQRGRYEVVRRQDEMSSRFWGSLQDPAYTASAFPPPRLLQPRLLQPTSASRQAGREASDPSEQKAIDHSFPQQNIAGVATATDDPLQEGAFSPYNRGDIAASVGHLSTLLDDEDQDLLLASLSSPEPRK